MNLGVWYRFYPLKSNALPANGSGFHFRNRVTLEYVSLNECLGTTVALCDQAMGDSTIGLVIRERNADQ